MNFKRIVLISLIFFQITILAILILNIIKKTDTQSKPKTIILSKNFINTKKVDNLKYYFDIDGKKDITDTAYWLNYDVVYKINNDGFNAINGSNYPVAKKKNVFRVMTLGDSFTFGIYVNTIENYPSKLELLLNTKTQCNFIDRFEVINLGVPGYDIQYSITRFKEKGDKYNPDLILWFLKNDDFEDINELVRSRIKYYENEIKQGKYKEYNEDFINAPLILSREDYLKENSKELILSKQKELLYSFSEIYKNKLVLFSYPSIEKEYIQLMREFGTSRNNIYIFTDISNIYTTGDYLDDLHPKNTGYTRIANDLLHYLINNQHIPCDLK